MSDEEMVEPADQLAIELEDHVIEKLRLRASSHGCSLDEEVHEIIRNAVKSESSEPAGLGTRLAARFRDIGLKEEIPELRGYPAVPFEFDP